MTARKAPEDLYRTLQHRFGEDYTQDATLTELAHRMPYKLEDGQQSNYAIFLVKAMIDSICSGRRLHAKTFPDEERMKLAQSIVEYYGDIHIRQLKEFEVLIDDGQLTIVVEGKNKNTMCCADRITLFLFFKAFYSSKRKKLRATSKSAAEIKRMPIYEKNDYYRTHGFSGRLIPKGLTAEEYWNQQPDMSDPIDRQAIDDIVKRVHELAESRQVSTL